MENGTHNWLQRLGCGEEEAFRLIYQHFFQRLHVFSVNITRSHLQSEEVVSDVFVQLWLRRAEAASIQDLNVYLYKAVKNRSLNALSRRANDLLTEPFDTLPVSTQPLQDNVEQAVISKELINQLQKAIDRLPPRCKMVFKLVREDGLSYKEVAEILNLSVKTVDAQMGIAIRKICQQLSVRRNRFSLRCIYQLFF
jgi:RNA polymerase sigma-70 factor (family 1)